MTTKTDDDSTPIASQMDDKPARSTLHVHNKDVEMTLTISTALNKKIFDSAKKNNATLSAEIANRLNASFILDDTTMESCLSSLTTLIARNELNAKKEGAVVSQTSLRLNRLLDDYRQLKKDSTISPAEIAYLAKFEHRGDTESWFSGEIEPSFADLGRLATFFNCDHKWLLFDKGVPYPLGKLRFGLSDASDLISSLIHCHSTKLALYTSNLIFVASKGENGDLMAIKVGANGNSESYQLPMNIADRIKPTQNEGLPILVLALEAIHNSDFESRSQGVIIEEHDFNLLLAGETPAMLVLDGYIDKSTHDWSKRIFKYDEFLKQDEVNYWTGFEDIVARTNTKIDHIYKEQRLSIKDKTFIGISRLDQLCLMIRRR